MAVIFDEFASIWANTVGKSWKFNPNLPAFLWRRRRELIQSIPAEVFEAVCEETVIDFDHRPTPEYLLNEARNHMKPKGDPETIRYEAHGLTEDFRDLLFKIDSGQVMALRLREPRSDKGPNFKILDKAITEDGEYCLRIEDEYDRKRYYVRASEVLRRFEPVEETAPSQSYESPTRNGRYGDGASGDLGEAVAAVVEGESGDIPF